MITILQVSWLTKIIAENNINKEDLFFFLGFRWYKQNLYASIQDFNATYK